MQNRVMALAVLAGFGVLAACGDKPDEAAEGREVYSQTITDDDGKTADVSVRQADDGNQNITVTTEDGKSVMKAVQGAGAEKYLPDWLPAYPGATVTGGMGAMQGGETGAMVSYVTDDAPAKVIAFYEKVAKDGGFKVEVSAVMGNTHILGASKDENARGFQVSAVAGEDGKTMISLVSARS